MRWWSGLGAVLLIAGLAVAGYVGAARAGWLRPDEAATRARYGLPASRYIDLHGQMLHVVDEGPRDAPVVVLVHGSFASLRSWDDWTQRLKARYRVIRFDRPGMGLSGPQPQGVYDGDAEAATIDALVRSLQLPPFVLVGTSSAGEGVAHYAAQHAGALRGVVLTNIAAGPLKTAPHLTPWFQAVLMFDGLLAGHHTEAFWAGVLRMNYADPARVTPALVTEWTDLNNRAQGWPHSFGKTPPFAGTPADLAAIHVPALVLWTDQDKEVPLATDGRETLARLGSSDKALRVAQDCGHMIAQECGPASVALALPFIDRVSHEGGHRSN